MRLLALIGVGALAAGLLWPAAALVVTDDAGAALWRLPVAEGSVVVLRGIQTVEQARELLVTYLNTRRTDGESDDLSPFEENVLPILIERSAGRPGILLQFAYKLFDRAADQGLPTIDREFAATILGAKKSGNTRGALFASVPDPSDARDIDDLLR